MKIFAKSLSSLPVFVKSKLTPYTINSLNAAQKFVKYVNSNNRHHIIIFLYRTSIRMNERTRKESDLSYPDENRTDTGMKINTKKGKC
jgi:hypothetical protein